MNDFISLTCPNCGGRLQITNDIERFSCAHCGVEQIVNRGEGVITLVPVLEKVTRGVDITASELALSRLDREIQEIKNQLADLENRLKKIIQLKLKGLIGIPLILVSVILLSGKISSSSSLCSLLPVFLLLFGIVLLIPLFIPPKNLRTEATFLEQRLAELRKEREYHRLKVVRH